MQRLPRNLSPPRRATTALLFALVSVLFGACPEASIALAEESSSGFQIVAHPSNPTSRAPRRVLASLFLKQVTRWEDGEFARPVDLEPKTTTRRHFSESVLNRSVSAVKSYWQQRIFSGRGVPPPELESDEAVVAYVLKHRGAVGYVSAAAHTGKARIILVE